jgi:hypothetical protein
MAYKVLALKSGVDSWQLHEQELRDDCTNEDVNKHRMVLEASEMRQYLYFCACICTFVLVNARSYLQALKHVHFVMKFPRVDLVEYLHEDKRVENHCEMLRG